MSEIKVDVPEGMPLNSLRKKILELIEEEEKRSKSIDRTKDMNVLSKIEIVEPTESGDQLSKEERKRIFDKYYDIIKLDRIVSMEEVLGLEEDTRAY